MRSVLMSLALGLVLCSTTLVQAASETASIDLQLFQVTPSSTGFFTVESGLVSPHLSFNAGFNLNYGHNLLQVLAVDPETAQTVSIGTVVSNRLDLDLTGNLGLFDWVDIGLVVPLVTQGGFQGSAFTDNKVDVGASDLKSFSLGDIRIVPKVKLWNLDNGLFAGAFYVPVSIPTAGGAAYTGEKNVMPQPALAMSTKVGDFRAALDLGYRVRFDNVVIDDQNAPATFSSEYFAKAGVGYMFNSDGAIPVELIGEIFGDTQSKYPFGEGTKPPQTTYQKTGTPAEGDIGLRIYADALLITVGAGGGLRPGAGAPLPRAFVSLTWDSSKVKLPDSDNDGVPDERDKCPDRQEDKDDFQDDDGCPEIDNDKDNVLDEDDQCPNEPEDKDGFDDEDGCPDPDNDKDGILDQNDKCPNEPEDKDGIKDDDGCPEVDADNDGIPDTLDKCPLDPEDMDGFEDFDGCPEADNDKDGLPDLNDQCPNIPEDKDGVADDDGCPEDNDGDGIPDEKDKCPNQAETYNGIKDEDGCPDATEKKSLVEVTEDKIEIKEAVYFKTGSAVIDKRSYEMLNQVAAVMKNFSTITKLRIEGHTDNQGPIKKNLALSQSRADSVRSYLIEHGVKGDRLQAKGFGPNKPIASNKSKAGQEKNRRVEFVIADRKQIGEEVKQAAPPPPPKVEEPSMELPGMGPAPAPGAGAPPPTVAPPANGAPGGDLFDVQGGDKGGKGKKAKGKKAKGKKDDNIQFGF